MTGPTRRNLFGGMALGLLLPQRLSAAQVPARLATLSLEELHLVIRGIAMLDQFADPLLDEDGAVLLAEITGRVPHAAALVALYRAYRQQPGFAPARTEQIGDLSVLHECIARGRGLSMRYTDLEGVQTVRDVLPLALVHPPHGIQLLGWCELRGDLRKFFVRGMAGLRANGTDFNHRHATLYAALTQAEGVSS